MFAGRRIQVWGLVEVLLTTLLVAGVLLGGVLLSPTAAVDAARNVPGHAISAVYVLDGGTSHSLLVRSDGTLWAWGRNANRQLGLSDGVDRFVPTQVGSVDSWSAVNTGRFHSLGLRSDGTLWAWGYSAYGQLGLGDGVGASTPTQVGSDTDWVAVSGGGNSSLGIRSDGSLWAWGYNGNGQLGVGDTSDRSVPTQVGSDTDWVAVAAGGYHSLGLRSDGTLWAWGKGNAGQLGVGDNLGRLSPDQVGSDTDWVAVGAGQDHSLGVRADGTLWAWGYNYYGQLGQGDNSLELSPVQVGGATNWVGVAAGCDHSLGWCSDGTLYAWGRNELSQLGLGDNTTRLSPEQVTTVVDCGAVAAGMHHSLGLRSDGTLDAWGHNDYGQLGLGDTSDRSTPTPVGLTLASPPLIDTMPAGDITEKTALLNGEVTSLDKPDFVAVAAGYNHSVGVRSDGTLWAWGRNYEGQLGTGDTTQRESPEQVGTSGKWVAVSACGSHSLGLRSDGTLWAWGSNSAGQLGQGDTTQRSSPTQVGSATTWVAASAGMSYSLGLRSDGTLWAWGSNSDGQLGLGDTSTRFSPEQVGTATDWVAVCAGYYHSLGLRSNGTLWSWGDNFSGQLGLGVGDTTDRSIPEQVGSATTWVAVSGGFMHSLALRSDGTIWSWGDNGQYQLGYIGLGRQAPGQVGADSDWVVVSAGGMHSLGLRSHGTLWCWGENGSGELGLGDTTDRSSPQRIGSAYSWVTGSAGYCYSLGLQSDGSLWATGSNFYGQLGLGDTTTRTTMTELARTRQAWFEWGLTTEYGNSTPPQTVSGTGPFNAQVTGLEEGETYNYRACFAGWRAVLGENQVFTTAVVAPPVPVLIYPANAKVTADSTPWLDWSDVSDPSGVRYRLQVDNNADFSSPILERTSLRYSSYTLPSMVDGKYYWRAAAVDGAGNASGWTSAWSFTVDTTAPPAPDLKYPDDGTVTGDNTPWLDWTDVSDATAVRYQLQVDDNKDFSSPVVFKGTGTRSSGTTPALADDVYNWRVRAVDAAGNTSAWTDAWTIRVDTSDPPLPILVYPADGTITTDTTPWLDWSDVYDAAGVRYHLQVDDNADFSSLVVNKSGLTLSSRTLAVLADGTYYWRVRAVDGAGNAGAWASAWSFTIDTTPPPLPSLVYPADGTVTSDTTPWLNWTDVSDATAVHYQLQVDDNADFSSPVVNKSTGSWSSNTLPELSDGTYYWRVMAVDGAGNASAWTAAWSFTIA